MNCWSVLGLEPDADTRSIKRQYAALLKQHRPDEDPEGFQRLRDAYEQALNWSAEWQEVQAFDPAPTFAPLDVLPLNDGSTPAWKLAEQLLEGITADNLVERMEQARTSYCEAEFEGRLLLLCLSSPEVMKEMAEPVVQHLYWLTPWQRQDISYAATEPVLNYLLNHTEHQLHSALDTGNIQRLLDLCRNLEQKAWLQTLDRRQWLNECLARLLLNATFWSNPLFDALCASQGWKQTGNLTPWRYWSELLQRSHSSAFLEEQQRLAAQKSESPDSRAARLLFQPMQEDARVQLTAAFNKADWQMCEHLANTVQHRYPQLASEMPGMDPYFWRPLQRSPAVWALPLAILGSTGEIAFNDYFRLGSSLLETLSTMLEMAALFGLLAWCVSWVCRAVALNAWRTDKALRERCGHWLSLRRPTPLPLRESLPGWLLAIPAFLAGGIGALLVYTAVLLGLALLSRTSRPDRRKQAFTESPPGSWLREMRIGIAFGLLASSLWVAVAIINYRPLGEDQGMHPWPLRLCATLDDTSPPCQVQVTRQQWYAPSTQGGRP